MRFWITVCVGIIAISGFSSAAYVYYPEAFGFGKAESIRFTSNEGDPVSSRKLPLLEFDRIKVDVDQVKQFAKGESVYHLRNEGEGDLRIELGAKSCTCAAIRIEKDGRTVARFAKSKDLEDLEEKLEENRKDSVADAAEGGGNVDPSGKIYLKPGETADFVIEWESRNSIGVKTLTGSVLTNDERSDRREVEFVVRLNVYPELVAEPGLFSFGQLRDGQERQESIYLYSLVHEDLSVEFKSASSEAITVALRPMNEEEKSVKKAKSGFMATATVKGRLPVGDYSESVIFQTNLPNQGDREISVVGFVNGDIEVHPGQVDFGTVSQSGGASKRVSISAKSLPDDVELRVDEKGIQTEPLGEDLVGAKIERQNFRQVWLVEVFVKPTKRVGRFKAYVPIVDSKGEQRATITVTGNLAVAEGSK